MRKYGIFTILKLITKLSFLAIHMVLKFNYSPFRKLVTLTHYFISILIKVIYNRTRIELFYLPFSCLIKFTFFVLTYYFI